MSRTRCRHVCRCGAVLVCGEPDKCAAGERWECPACELAAADAYWENECDARLERAYADYIERTQEI